MNHLDVGFAFSAAIINPTEEAIERLADVIEARTDLMQRMGVTPEKLRETLKTLPQQTTAMREQKSAGCVDSKVANKVGGLK